MGRRPWFRERASGLGWTPVSWEGWLITLLGAALVVGVNLAIVAQLSGRR